MKRMSLLMFVFCALALSGIIAFTGCTAAKNTGTAVSEGTKEAAEKTGEVVTDGSITAAYRRSRMEPPYPRTSGSLATGQANGRIRTIRGQRRASRERESRPARLTGSVQRR